MRLQPRVCTPPPLISHAKHLRNKPSLFWSSSSSLSDVSEIVFNSGNEVPNTECEVDNFEYPSVIPLDSNPNLELPDWHEPHYADQPPIGFDEDEWPHIWNSHQYGIDRFLVYGSNLWGGYSTPWFQEYEFMGIRWRLLVDRGKAPDQIPYFTRGMVLLFQDCNNQNHRYIIDHCAYRDEANAYLKVICFDQHRRFCASWSKYPPIILVVPIDRCKVRMHPNAFMTSPVVHHPSLSQIFCSFRVKWQDKLSGKSRTNLQAMWRRLTFWKQ